MEKLKVGTKYNIYNIVHSIVGKYSLHAREFEQFSKLYKYL